MKSVRALSLAGALLTLAGAAMADGPPAASAQPPPAPAWLAPSPAPYQAPPSTGSIWRGFGALLLLGGLGGVAVYARKRRRGVGAGPGATPALRVLETARLGQNGELVVAEVFGEVMLLGVTPQSIRRIATFRRPAAAEPDAAASAPSNAAAEAQEPAPFASALKALLHRAPARADASVDSAAGNAAVALADRTTDTLERRSPPRSAREAVGYHPTRSEPEPPRKPAVEGQAAGLRRRRP